MKASDISDEALLDAVRAATPVGFTWAMRGNVLPEYPEKVVLAKARKLIRRGVLEGCACGCRGDWRARDE